jgi:glyoxylate reductase
MLFPGISVSNTPNINIYAVADLTMFLMIGALRQITAPINAFRAGTCVSFQSRCQTSIDGFVSGQTEWRGKNFTLGHDPQGKLLGILGMGGIGSVSPLKQFLFFFPKPVTMSY